MEALRFQVVGEAFKKKPLDVTAPIETPAKYFGRKVFNREKMYKYLSKDVYEKMINDYFNNTFKHMMKIPTYIVDFAILKNNEIKLIEFSPFLRCTSARLFRLDNDHE